MTGGEVYVAIQALAATARAMLATVETAFTAEDLTQAAVGSLRGSVAAQRTEAMRLLTTLAGVDFSEDAIPGDAEAVFAALRWQTATQVALVRLEGALRTADEMLAAIDAAPELRRVLTRQGDTLEKIAARELRDFRRWSEIASLNNLAAGAAPQGALWVPTR